MNMKKVIKIREIASIFPRELGFPQRRICYSEKQFYEMMNCNNKMRDIYYSLYNCDKKHNFDKCLIDKVAFDFDAIKPEQTIPDVIKLHKFLNEKNIKHLVVFSGKKGFHVYIFVMGGENLQYKKDALFNCHMFFRDTLNINPDEKLFGDIKRILRVPNSFHPRGLRYCIPVTLADLNKGFVHIKEKARSQNFNFTYYGIKYFDITQFDNERPRRYVEVPEFDYDIKVDDDLIKDFLPCMKRILLDEDKCASWEMRFEFGKYCRDLGLPRSVADKIAKKYFSRVKRTDGGGNNYTHFRKVKCLDYAYGGGEFVRSCSTLYQFKACVGKCKAHKKRGFPLYK